MFKTAAAIAALSAALLAPSAPAANLPRRAPEFAIQLNDGKQVLLSSYKGKVVALIFILTYCPHCQKTIGVLNKLQPEFESRGFQVLASAIEDMAKAAVPDFIRRFQPVFPLGFNNRESVNDFMQHPVMVTMLMPQLALIDRAGNVRTQFGGNDKIFGEDQEKLLRVEIEKLLAEKSAAPARKKAAGPAKKATTPAAAKKSAS